MLAHLCSLVSEQHLIKPLSGLGIKDASIVVELGVMRESFKEVYSAGVRQPGELLERA